MAMMVVRYGSLGGDDIGHAAAENNYLSWLAKNIHLCTIFLAPSHIHMVRGM